MRVSMLGIAVFDRQRHYVAVNKTLANLHGIGEGPHRESIIGRILMTGESI
jgi:hypothetical protein